MPGYDTHGPWRPARATSSKHIRPYIEGGNTSDVNLSLLGYIEIFYLLRFFVGIFHIFSWIPKKVFFVN